MSDNEKTPRHTRSDGEDPDSVAGLVATLIDEWPIDPETVARLEHLLCTDDEAVRQYAALADLDARLRWIHRGGRIATEVAGAEAAEVLALAGQTREPHAVAATANTAPRRVTAVRDRGLRSKVALAALAASLLLALTLGYQFLAPELAIGRLTEFAAVKWGDPDNRLKKGSRIDSEPLTLLEGVIEITLLNDTRLIVEGPAEFQLVSDMKAFLKSGTASVFVADSISGYTLDSRDVRVVDLGTAFQMSVSDLGTEVQVLDGKVVATAKRPARGGAQVKEIELSERDAVRFAKGNESIEKVEFSGGRLKLRGPNESLAAIPVAVTGDIRCLEQPPASVAVGELEDDNSMHLFVERSDCTLERPIYADRNAEGYVADVHGTAKLALPLGTPVNSYLLHYDTTNEEGDYTLKRVSGTITFRTPIVGVFYSHVGLYTSDKYLQCEDTRYRHGEGFGLRSLDAMDFLSFSPDHKTIIVNLQANTGADHLRIVTMGDQPD